MLCFNFQIYIYIYIDLYFYRYNCVQLLLYGNLCISQGIYSGILHGSCRRNRGVQTKPRPDLPAKTVQFGQRTGRPDVSDKLATGLYPLNPKTTGQLAGLRLRNQFSTDPTVSQSHAIFFPICQENKIQFIQFAPDLFKIRRDLIEIRLDWPDLFEICRDLVKIQSSLARFGDFWKNLADFLTT